MQMNSVKILLGFLAFIGFIIVGCTAEMRHVGKDSGDSNLVKPPQVQSDQVSKNEDASKKDPKSENNDPDRTKVEEDKDGEEGQGGKSLAKSPGTEPEDSFIKPQPKPQNNSSVIEEPRPQPEPKSSSDIRIPRPKPQIDENLISDENEIKRLIDQFNQNRNRPTKAEIHILLVLDTSGSNLFELNKGVLKFLQQLLNSPLALHESIGVKIGVLTSRKNQSRPATLNFIANSNTDIFKDVLVTERYDRHSRHRLGNDVSQMLSNMIDINTSDTAESILVALNRFLEEGAIDKIRREANFLTKDVLNVILFASDENDPCKKGTQPDHQGVEPKILASKACEKFTMLKLVQNLTTKFDGSDLIVGGFVYTDDSKIKRNSKIDPWSEENEIGLGYMELINYFDSLKKFDETYSNHLALVPLEELLSTQENIFVNHLPSFKGLLAERLQHLFLGSGGEMPGLY